MTVLPSSTDMPSPEPEREVLSAMPAAEPPAMDAAPAAGPEASAGTADAAAATAPVDGGEGGMPAGDTADIAAPVEAAAAAEADAAESEDAEPAEAAPRPRPPHVPEKFWDAARGEVRVDALLESYAELERKLGRMVSLPEGPEDEAGRRRLLRALGWPVRPEDYDFDSPHPLIERDPELDRRLHEAGFTRDQAKLVYELAAERLLPAVAEVVAEATARRERERLEAHFGGRERFEAIARELRDFAQRRLDPATAEALSSSYEGVLALHRMALAEEPELFAEAEGGGLVPDEDQLVEMMRDPRYWRDHDPEFVAQVTEGFRRLYGD